MIVMIHQTTSLRSRRGREKENLPSTNNSVQQHVGNWVEVVDGADSCEAAHDYD